MNTEQFSLFLSAGAWICAVGAIGNLLLLKKRGTSALLMSAAFLTLGGIFWLLKTGAASGLVVAASILLAFFLIGDFALRSRNQVTK